MILKQKDCDYIIIGICEHCHGRVAAASSVDGPLAVSRRHPYAVNQTPQCRDCGATPKPLAMNDRRMAVAFPLTAPTAADITRAHAMQNTDRRLPRK